MLKDHLEPLFGWVAPSMILKRNVLNTYRAGHETLWLGLLVELALEIVECVFTKSNLHSDHYICHCKVKIVIRCLVKFCWLFLTCNVMILGCQVCRCISEFSRRKISRGEPIFVDYSSHPDIPQPEVHVFLLSVHVFKLQLLLAVICMAPCCDMCILSL